MAGLQVGRLDLVVEPSEWSIERGLDSHSYTFRGFLIASDKDTTVYIRNELINHHGDLIALTWDRDPYFDGYYYITDVRVETVPMSYLRRGLYPFELSLYRVGGHATTELQSLITSGDRLNDFATTPQPYHAVPVGTLAYNAGTGDPEEITRDTEDGTMSVFLDIDPDQDPAWSVPPSGYYDGAVKVYTQDLLRTGRELPASDPTDWYMTNGLIQVRAQTYQGASNGRFEIRPFDGAAYDSWIDFKIVFNPSGVNSDIPQWHFMTVVKNTPEACIVKLIRDAATVPASANRHTLDFLLRRGAPFVECIYHYSGGDREFRIARDTGEAAQRPGGTASYIYADATTDGHRWVLGAVHDFTANLTSGHITFDVNTDTQPFFIGFAINNASSGSGDGPADLTQQYNGPVAETVRGVRR